MLSSLYVTWLATGTTRYLEAEPAKYITVARKAKGTDNWFVGGKCDAEGHQSVVRLNFLDKGTQV